MFYWQWYLLAVVLNEGGMPLGYWASVYQSVVRLFMSHDSTWKLK